MKRFSLILIFFFSVMVFKVLAQDKPALPVFDLTTEKHQSADWLVHPIKTKAVVYGSADNKDIVLYNGLVKRVFRLTDTATIKEKEGIAKKYKLNRNFEAELAFTIDPDTFTWFVVE